MGSGGGRAGAEAVVEGAHDLVPGAVGHPEVFRLPQQPEDAGAAQLRGQVRRPGHHVEVTWANPSASANCAT